MRTVVLAAAFLLASTQAFAHEAQQAPKPAPKPQTEKPAEGPGHSGGTDAYGCHTNHQTGVYHCHRPK